MYRFFIDVEGTKITIKIIQCRIEGLHVGFSENSNLFPDLESNKEQKYDYGKFLDELQSSGRFLQKFKFGSLTLKSGILGFSDMTSNTVIMFFLVIN